VEEKRHKKRKALEAGIEGEVNEGGEKKKKKKKKKRDGDD